MARSAGAGFERYAAGDSSGSRCRACTPRWARVFPIFSWTALPGLVAGRPGTQVRRRSGSYHHFVEAMVRHLQRTGGDAAWLVCDAAFVHKYGLGVILPGTRRLIADPLRLCLRG